MRLCVDRTAKCFHALFHDWQAEAASALRPDICRPVERIVDAWQVTGWDADAAIFDAEYDFRPVTGNNDLGLPFRDTELVTIGPRRFLLHHIVDPKNPPEKLKKKLIRQNPDVVVFGHTHKPFCETVGNTLFLNPGYAGPQRFKLPRTVAVLHCDAEGITTDFHEL